MVRLNNTAFLLLAAIALAPLSAACSDEASASGSGGNAGVGGAGGQGGAAQPPPGCADDIVWSTGGTVAPARDHHGTFGFEIGGEGFLFVNGGTDYAGVFDDSHVAALGDGTDNSWQWAPLPQLSAPRAGHGVATIGERVFLAGGRRPGAFTDSVVVASIQEGGSLTAWEEVTALPESRFHLAMVAAGDQLIVTGGLLQASGSASDTVFWSKNNEGALSEWQVSQLPHPLSHHASFVAGEYIYLAGGLSGAPADNPPLLDEVWRAPILESGGVGTWEAMPPLPSIRATHGAFVRGRCVYMTAGITGPLSYSDTVIAAPFNEQGELGAWVTLPSLLPAGRSHLHHIALIHDQAYLLGGSLSYQNVTGESAVGRFVHSQ